MSIRPCRLGRATFNDYHICRVDPFVLDTMQERHFSHGEGVLPYLALQMLVLGLTIIRIS